MYRKTRKLSSGEEIVIETDRDWTSLSLYKDDLLIGSIEGREELKAGRTFALPNGIELRIQMTDYSLEVWESDHELMSGRKSGIESRFDKAVTMLFFIGTFQVTAVVAIYIRKIEALMPTIILGIVIATTFFGLGLWAKRTGDKKPFWIGFVIGAISLLLALVALSITDIFVNTLLLYSLYRGIKSESSTPARKENFDENAPLDSGL